MRILILAVSLFLLATLFIGCGGRTSVSTIAPQADRASVERAMDVTWDSLRRQDLDAFMRHAVADWHLYTARGNRVSASQLFSNHRQNMTNFDIVISNLDIRIHGDVAWATYDGTMSGLWQGEKWGGDFIFTSVFEREGAGWRLAHTHESRKPDA